MFLFLQKFLNKVEEVFLCICCQEVVFQPITTECQHNVCRVRNCRLVKLRTVGTLLLNVAVAVVVFVPLMFRHLAHLTLTKKCGCNCHGNDKLKDVGTKWIVKSWSVTFLFCRNAFSGPSKRRCTPALRAGTTWAKTTPWLSTNPCKKF